MLVQESEVTLTVWPTWVGLAVDIGGLLMEPVDAEYTRGQIFWRMENGVVVGGGGVVAPRGTYHALVYSHTPDGPCLPGSVRLPHPLTIHGTEIVTVDPITQGDDITHGNRTYQR